MSYKTTQERIKPLKLAIKVLSIFAMGCILTILVWITVHITDRHEIISLRASNDALRAELRVKDSLLGKDANYTPDKYLRKYKK